MDEEIGSKLFNEATSFSNQTASDQQLFQQMVMDDHFLQQTTRTATSQSRNFNKRSMFSPQFTTSSVRLCQVSEFPDADDEIPNLDKQHLVERNMAPRNLVNLNGIKIANRKKINVNTRSKPVFKNTQLKQVGLKDSVVSSKGTSFLDTTSYDYVEEIQVIQYDTIMPN